MVALALVDFVGGSSVNSISDRSGGFAARHLHSVLIDGKMSGMMFLLRVSFLLFLGFSAGSVSYLHEKKLRSRWQSLKTSV